MPPVPKVILAMPGPHAALADEGRLLVADERRDRRRAGERGGPARRRRRSRRPAAASPAGCAARRGPCRPSREPSPRAQAGDAGVGGVGDVHARPRTGARRARCRRCRRTGRGCGRGRPGRAGGATLVADAFGARRMPSAWSTRQAPTVRRSCQPSAGADRLAGGAVPHDGGGPLVGDADRVDRRRPRRARLGPRRGRRAAISAASNSTRPGAGESGRSGAVVLGGDGGVRARRRRPAGRSCRRR